MSKSKATKPEIDEVEDTTQTDEKATNTEEASKEIKEEQHEAGAQVEEDTVKVQFTGKNASFTVGIHVFKPEEIKELTRELAELALRNEGFSCV